MGERKVLNKYYPPDFDPANLPRNRMPPDRQMKVRMMLPMSIRCKTCGTFMYKGTKFNSRKEDVLGEDYLGIQIYRFYMRCSTCGAEMTMKTDPKNHDYVVEHGASRNYEPWREGDKVVDDSKRKRDDEEKGNAMKALENRTLDSKREMDVLSALDELRSLNKRKQDLTQEQLLSALKNSMNEDGEDADIDEEDEEAIALLFLNERKKLRLECSRIQDDDGDDGSTNLGSGNEPMLPQEHSRLISSEKNMEKEKSLQGKVGSSKFACVPKFVIKKKIESNPSRSQNDPEKLQLDPVLELKHMDKPADRQDSQKTEHNKVSLVSYCSSGDSASS